MSPSPHANVSRREASPSAPERARESPGRAAHSGREARHDNRLATIRAAVGAAGAGVYLGAGSVGPAWAGTEQAVLVLGPPRSGKTSSIVVPTVLGAPGAVVSTSTKPDVLQATADARQTVGPCLLYDPSGTVEAPRGVERVRWSPVESCRSWDDALLVARSLVGAARPGAGARERRRGGRRPLDRARRGSSRPHTACRCPRRRGPRHRAVVGRPPQRRAGVGDPRPQRGHPSRRPPGGHRRHRPPGAERHLVDGVGRPGRLPQRGGAGQTVAPDFDARAFCDSSATLYVCATGRHQAVAAPLVVGLLTDIRTAAYARSTAPAGAGPEPGARAAPVVLALDEVANIAPIPDLPGMVSEGGGQGLLTLACLQDLSQARGRWGSAADGFLSLFGTTVVLPGIGDVRTLEALSSLAGEQEILTRSVSAPVRGPAVWARCCPGWCSGPGPSPPGRRRR